MVNEHGRLNVAGAQPDVCPYLGVYNDPDSYWPTVSNDNRCYALGAATSVDESEQRHLCLGGAYASCPRFCASGRGAGGAKAGAARSVAPRGAFLGSPLVVAIGGGVALLILLACTIGLVLYQTNILGRRAPTPTGEPVILPTEIPPEDTEEPPTLTPAPTNTLPAPTLTRPPSATSTRPSPSVTPLPTMTATPPRTPTLPPTATRPPATPVPPTSTPRPTSTPYPTSTPRPTFTISPTRSPTNTLTPTRTVTPTAVPYGVQLSVGQTAAQIRAGQTASFEITLRNTGGVTDSIGVQLYPALLGGWSAKIFVDGADQGAGPVTVQLAAGAAKPVSLRIAAAADAAAGDAGEAIVTAVSQSYAPARDSLQFTVSVVQ